MDDAGILAQATLLSDIKTEILAVSSTVLQANYLPDLIEELEALPNPDYQERELLGLARIMLRCQYAIAALMVNMENQETASVV